MYDIPLALDVKTLADFSLAMYVPQYNWGYGFAEPLTEMCT